VFGDLLTAMPLHYDEKLSTAAYSRSQPPYNPIFCHWL